MSEHFLVAAPDVATHALSFKPTALGRRGAAFAAACSMAMAGAHAATPGDAQARFEQERARCLSGLSGQAQSTCLKEAGAALEEARRGRLDDGDARYRKNARERCDVLAGDEKRDCMARARDQRTNSSGSVEGGGILRETVTRETRPVEPSASMPAMRAEPPAPPLRPEPPAPAVRGEPPIPPVPSLPPSPGASAP